MTARWIGKSVTPLDDRRHLTGVAAFVDDLERSHALHAAFVRSPFAAAHVTELQRDDALSIEGVERVITARDLGERTGLRPTLDRPEFIPVTMPLLASDRVRHAGEPIALVLGSSPHAAEDGAEAVGVAYEAEEPIVSIESALAPGAAAVHEHAPDNVLLDVATPLDPEVERAFETAHVVVAGAFSTGRVTAVPMEARACLAEWDARRGRLVLFTSTQVPFLVRTAVAEAMGLPEQSVRVVALDVGGGFGQKCVVGREEILVALAAAATRRPVKWAEDRQENLSASFHGHEQRYEATAAFDRNGRLAALKADIACDVGAYSCYPFTCGVEPLMAASELPGPYRLERYWSRARAIATNKAPTAPYRGVSRPQLTFVMERLMQKAATRLGTDGLELRRVNLITDDAFPYRSPTGIVYDPGSYRESLDLCARAMGSESWQERQGKARRAGRLIGLGFSCFAERTAYGTRAFGLRKMAITPGFDSARVLMDPSGNVTVMVGTCGHGQGHSTTFAQIAAEQLGLEVERVNVQEGDTDAAPFGWGTFASRSLVIGGGAARRACELLAEQLKRVAGHLLETDPEDLEIGDGRIFVSGSPDSFVETAAVARAAHLEAHLLPEGEAGGLEAHATFDPPGTFSNAAHGVLLEIDPEVGSVRIDRYVVAEDCGVMINPMIVEGQVRGGVAQGVAAALYEQLVYDDQGQLLNTTLMDYLVPTAAEIPPVEVLHLETPCAYTETGAKGMGEGGTMGAPAAIACAVTDALAHLGVEIDSLPITPDRLLAAIKERAP